MQLEFIKPQGIKLPNKLFKILSTAVRTQQIDGEASQALTFNFRDPDYSAEYGGYHPVEVRIERSHTCWQLIYMTDFSYQGHPFAELAKEIDICFTRLRLTTLFGGEHCAIANYQFINTFICNFIEYHAMDAFEVSIEIG